MILHAKHYTTARPVALTIEGGIITTVGASAENPTRWVAPAFFDPQINGCLGIAFNSREELVENPQVKLIIQKELDHFNRTLDRQEKIRRFALLPSDFCIETGEITPSLKVKRKVVDEKFKTIIDGMYADESGIAAD